MKPPISPRFPKLLLSTSLTANTFQSQFTAPRKSDHILYPTMARSARASVIKRNSSNLRSKVFGPADDARTARLSAKLIELAQQPKPNKLLEEMEIEGEFG